MNIYYSLPSDIREKIDVTLTKMKQAELQVQLKKQLRRKVYRLFIEKSQYVVADLESCEQRICSFSEEDRMIMCQVGENPDMYEDRLYDEKKSLERVIDEYDVFLDSL